MKTQMSLVLMTVVILSGCGSDKKNNPGSGASGSGGSDTPTSSAARYEVSKEAGACDAAYVGVVNEVYQNGDALDRFFDAESGQLKPGTAQDEEFKSGVKKLSTSCDRFWPLYKSNGQNCTAHEVSSNQSNVVYWVDMVNACTYAKNVSEAMSESVSE